MEDEPSSPKQRPSFIESFRRGMTEPISDEARARARAWADQPDEDTNESLLVFRAGPSPDDFTTTTQCGIDVQDEDTNESSVIVRGAAKPS